MDLQFLSSDIILNVFFSSGKYSAEKMEKNVFLFTLYNVRHTHCNGQF